MRILLAAKHDYPARESVSSGLRPTRYPSGSGGAMHDLIAKGLAELGHDVFYLVPHAPGLPRPVTAGQLAQSARRVVGVRGFLCDVDVTGDDLFRGHEVRQLL